MKLAVCSKNYQIILNKICSNGYKYRIIDEYNYINEYNEKCIFKTNIKTEIQLWLDLRNLIPDFNHMVKYLLDSELTNWCGYKSATQLEIPLKERSIHKN